MEINLGGRKIPLLLTTLELIDIQEEIGCTVAQLRDEVFGLTEDDEPDENGKPVFRFGVVNEPKKIRKMGTLIRILGNAGLEEAGETPDLTDKWVLRALPPGWIIPMAVILVSVVHEAMKQEKTEEKQSGPVDVTIEEENRKKEPRK